MTRPGPLPPQHLSTFETSAIVAMLVRHFVAIALGEEVSAERRSYAIKLREELDARIPRRSNEDIPPERAEP